MSDLKIPRKIFLVSLALVFCCVFAASAQAKSWRVSDFQDRITVAGDGTAEVTERITLEFVGEWHGIHRTIPIEYPGPDGTNYELFLKVTSVSDGAGGVLKYDSSVSNGTRDLKIYIPDAVDATRTVEIVYNVRNGTRFFDSHDEFYWNVTGNDWPVPIEHAAATVRFPGNAAGSLSAQAFTGVYGSQERDASAKVAGAETLFETNNPLPMRGGLTIDVYIPKGILKEPSALTKFFWFIGGNPILFLPLVTLAGMFSLWWVKGRDPDPGMSVAPMYEPPAGISPAEAGTLLDDSIHPRDITSTIVDLAVRGYIKIEETADKGLVFTHKDYVFHLLKPMAQWNDAGLAPHERVMLENVFQGGEETRLSSLKNRFYTAVPIIRQDIMAALKNKGIYLLDPESANGYSVVAAIAIVAPFGIMSVSGLGEFFQLDSPLGCVPAVVGCHLVAVCAGDECEDGQGSACPYCGARLPGIYESCRWRAAQANASDHVREISAVRDGAGRGASLGAGVCRDRQRSAAMVCGAGRSLSSVQSDFLFQFHEQHGVGYAPGIRVGAAREFDRVWLWRRRIRWWRRRVLGRRIWRWRGQRVLGDL